MEETPRKRKPGGGRKAGGTGGSELSLYVYDDDRARLTRLAKPGESCSDAFRRILREYEESQRTDAD